MEVKKNFQGRSGSSGVPSFACMDAVESPPGDLVVGSPRCSPKPEISKPLVWKHVFCGESPMTRRSAGCRWGEALATPHNDLDTGAGVGRRRSLPASRRRRGIPPRPHRRSGHPFAPAGAAQSGVRLWRKARKPAGTEKFGYAGTWDTQRSCVTEPHPLTDQDTKESQTNHSPRLAPGRGDGSGAEVPRRGI